jgi:hypothetical protein
LASDCSMVCSGASREYWRGETEGRDLVMLEFLCVIALHFAPRTGLPLFAALRVGSAACSTQACMKQEHAITVVSANRSEPYRNGQGGISACVS